MLSISCNQKKINQEIVHALIISSLFHLWLWLQQPFKINLVNIHGTEVPTVVFSQEWM